MWSGSHAERLSMYLPLISYLKNYSDLFYCPMDKEEVEFEKYIQEQKELEMGRWGEVYNSCEKSYCEDRLNNFIGIF